ncbi:MAG: hypothetical protein HQL65_12480, partial [Magnetococcales bacterium]|nr:hypothetical protein [Magnetococcales bacterium]
MQLTVWFRNIQPDRCHMDKKPFYFKKMLLQLFQTFFLSLLGLLLPITAFSETQPAQQAAQVKFFSPNGFVKKVRQVTVRFTRPMVAFGDPRLSEPFVSQCPIAGKGRWVDSRNWAYDFDQDLPAGIQCTFTPKPGLRTLAGEAVASQEKYSFNTGGPTILSSLPYKGGSIDEEQIFILGLDTPATPDSVPANINCAIEGVGEKVGVRLLTGKDRQDILHNHPDFLRNFRDMYPGTKKPLQTTQTPGESKTSEKHPDLVNGENSPIVVVQCQRRLPNKAKVDLVWGKGIRSQSGVETQTAQNLSFLVRDQFSARFSCQRTNKDAHCIPVLPMHLILTVPISSNDAQRIQLKGKDGKIYPTRLGTEDEEQDDNSQTKKEKPTKEIWVSRITFPGPFPELSDFTVEVPPGLKDDAGRILVNQGSFPLAVKTDMDPPLAK